MEAHSVTQPPTLAEIAALAQVMLLGTRKRPVTLPPSAAALLPAGSPLPPAALALVLVGQSGRFERPSAPTLSPATEAAMAVHADPRPMLSEVSRRLLKQLLALAKGHAPEVVFQAVRERAAARGLRLHPFDMPGFTGYLRVSETTDIEYHGEAGERADRVLDAESWKALPREQRAPALRQLRHVSPDAARTLLETTFRSETPRDRATFLMVLAIHLSAADLPFLESAARERAEGVREAAADLASRVPGTNAYRERLDRATRLFVRDAKNAGGMPVLSLVKGRLHHEIQQELAGIRLLDLAERFGLSLGAFVDALSTQEDILPVAVLPGLVAEGDGALAAALIRRLSGPRAMVALFSGNWAYGFHISSEQRPVIVEALVDLAISGAFPDGQSLLALYQTIRGPLPEPPAAKLLASESWRTHVSRLASPEADHKTPNAVKETALLIPDSMMGTFLASIQPLSPHLTLPARLFAEFCQSLAETMPVAPLTQAP
jgi:hypothetical protein